MATYAELVASIRNWTNVDSTVLTDSVVEDFVTIAADECYRKLKLPELEKSSTYTILAGDLSSNKAGNSLATIALPTDLVEMIDLRIGDEIISEIVGTNVFYDDAIRKSEAHYTRVGQNILVNGDIAAGNVVSFHYYAHQLDTLTTGTNYLRENKFQILLFGALKEAFFYVEDFEKAKVYDTRFVEMINSLNTEANMRKYQGGIVTTSFKSHLI